MLRTRLLRAYLSRPANADLLWQAPPARGPCCTCALRFSTSSQPPALFAPSPVRRRRLPSRDGGRRGMAVAAAATASPAEGKKKDIGPLETYDVKVQEGRLRKDDHQRGIITKLQDLHDRLKPYTPPRTLHLAFEEKPKYSGGLFGLFSKKPQEPKIKIPPNVPRGLYLHGGVGGGKTMLMDLFFQTLPKSIRHKQRIHFHHFMQDVHKRLHALRASHGNSENFDALPYVGADIAEDATVLCFDEFQCTDVADAMILRRLLETLMGHGVVLVATSNREPDELYKNGIQRESFLPCIALLKEQLDVVNLDSDTDYRKIARPQAEVYTVATPGSPESASHADKWFAYFSSPSDPPRPAQQTIWGRKIAVPLASGHAAKFSFTELCGSPLSAADYLELARVYKAFVVTDVPSMNHRSKDLARRFITFIDAAYESKAKLALTTEVPLQQLFMSKEDMAQMQQASDAEEGEGLDSAMRSLMDDLGLNMKMLKYSSIFSGDEEKFAFARALSRLSEMQGKEWVEAKVNEGEGAAAA